MRLTKSRIVSIILGVVVVASSVALLVRHRSNGGPPRAAGSPSATASSSSPTPFDTPTPTSSSSPGAGKTSGRPARDPRVQQPAFSRDGGVVAFTSIDPLTSNDTDRVADVFVRDRRTHTTTGASVATDGTQGNGASSDPAVSADGTKIAFVSSASNLVPGDTNGVPDVFVRDLVAHTTVRVSVSSSGAQGNRASGAPSISGNGRLVAFSSPATDLVSGDGNGVSDVFVHDLTSGATTAASITPSGSTGNGESGRPSIAADGRSIAFESRATDLTVPPIVGGEFEVYVRDLASGTTTRASVDSEGTPIPGESRSPALSATGRFVAFVRSGAGSAVTHTMVMRRDLTGHKTVTLVDCGEDTCVRVALAADGLIAAYVKELGGTDGFCYVQPAARGYVGACPSGWVTISGDGRFVGFDAEIDARSDPKDRQRFGGHRGAMIYERSSQSYVPAWLS